MRVIVVAVGLTIGLLLSQVCAVAQMTVSLHGDFGDSGSMNVEPPAAEDITMQTLDHTHEFGHASYSVKGQGLGSTISVSSMTGPAMYAFASTKGGELGAVSRATVSWNDVIRLDDGGDPNVLETAPQMAGLSLGLELYVQGNVQSAASNGSYFSYDVGLGQLYYFQERLYASDEVGLVLGPYAISDYKNAIESGLELSVTIIARSFTNPGETTSAEAGLEINSFRFILTNSQGNLVPYDEIPSGVHVASVNDPNRWYPLLPEPGTSALGDYNRDGKVDAADYVIWRGHFGESVVPGTGADGNGNGQVDVNDFDIWRGNFGPTASSGSAISVPEPDIAQLCAAALAIHCAIRRRSRKFATRP